MDAMSSRTAIVLFTRDLRTTDNPALMEGFEALGYPQPIVDHDDAVAEFRSRRES
jgi:deoxyribodipyrimidine photolyase